jgi:hypothetical protein
MEKIIEGHLNRPLLTFSSSHTVSQGCQNVFVIYLCIYTSATFGVCSGLVGVSSRAGKSAFRQISLSLFFFLVLYSYMHQILEIHGVMGNKPFEPS